MRRKQRIGAPASKPFWLTGSRQQFPHHSSLLRARWPQAHCYIVPRRLGQAVTQSGVVLPGLERSETREELLNLRT